MDAKLTLTLDRTTISSAKRYARNNHKSLSKVVEDYFRGLDRDGSLSPKYPALVEKLSGVISEQDLERIAEKDERARYILGERV